MRIPKTFLFTGILLLCLLVRFFCLLQNSWVQPQNDEKVYLGYAKHIATKGEFPGSFRPPGYPYFIAVLGSLGVRDVPLLTKWAQILLSLLTCLFLMWTSQTVFDEKTALVTGILFALYPNLAVFSTLLLSESLFIFFLVSSVALLIQGNAQSKWYYFAISGFLMGLAALTKSMILYFSPIIVLCLWKIPKQASTPRINAGIIFFFFFCITIIPWTIRNYRLFNSFILIESNAGLNFYIGNHPSTATWNKENIALLDFHEVHHSHKNDAERNHKNFIKGLEGIIQNPGTFLLKFFLQNIYLWTPDSDTLKYLRNGWYGKNSLFTIRVSTVLAVGFYCLIIITAFGGLILAPSGKMRELLLFLLGYYCLVHGVLYGVSRYRLPLIPFLIIFSSYFIMETIRKMEIPQEDRFRKKWGAAVISAFLVWGATFDVIIDTWKTGGVNYRFQFRSIPEISKETPPSSKCLGCKSLSPKGQGKSISNLK